MKTLTALRRRVRDRLSDISLYLTDDGAWARCPFCNSFAVHPYRDGPEDKHALECLDCTAPILNPRSRRGCV